METADQKPDLPKKSIAAAFAAGFALSMMTWLAGVDLVLGVIPDINAQWLIPLVGIAGALLFRSRFRKVLWVAAIAVSLATLSIAFTPVAIWFIGDWAQDGSLEKAPVCVVLAADGDEGQEITEKGQSRILAGYQVMHDGWAEHLIVTRGNPAFPSWIPAIEQQMKHLGLNIPVIATGPVRNTHDEALEASRICRENGWDKVILVTHPMHMRRASAVFEKTGLKVIRHACTEWRYNLKNLNNLSARIVALRECMKEHVGMFAYRRKGWVD